MTSSIRVIPAVAWVSFREILREKILYNTLLIAILLMGLGFLASKMTFVRPDRVILDFGISAVSLSLVAIAALVGAGLLNREIERRTIFLALSRPISRYQFVAGKFIGLAMILMLNWVLVSIIFVAIYILAGGAGSGAFSQTLLVALILLFFQSWMMAGIAVFFSTFSTTSLSAVFSIGVFLIGNNITQIHIAASKIHSAVESFAVNLITFVVPNFEYFNLGTQVTYGTAVHIRFLLVAIAYSLAVSGLGITLAGLFIHGKEA